MADNNPLTVSDLPIGVYTVEVIAVSSNNMSVENNRNVEMITVSDKSTESGVFLLIYSMCIISRVIAIRKTFVYVRT